MDSKSKVGIIAFVIIVIVSIYLYQKGISPFSDLLINSSLTNDQPKSFPPIETEFPKEEINLRKPDVPEEIGFAMLYPQGSGAGMSTLDSNSFYTTNPGPLLMDHTIPESYGESSLTDPTGFNGANQGARVLRLTTTGDQMKYKPSDINETSSFASAYSEGEVQKGPVYINGNTGIDYTDSFKPESNLIIQTSPGQESTLDLCEKTYPGVVKYNNFCITKGDIPYGKVINNEVNPRLVSRWESYTGDYSRPDALQDIDGVLYPNLNIMTASS